jgi:hypothetical protein
MAMLRDTTDRTPTSTAAKASLVVSSLALLLSGYAVVQSLDGDEERRDLDQRLVCLEKDGANDCGADGR